MAPKIPEDLSFTVEVWDETGTYPVETLARVGLFMLAKPLYQNAVKARPKDRIILRQKARTISDSGRRN